MSGTPLLTPGNLQNVTAAVFPEQTAETFQGRTIVRPDLTKSYLANLLILAQNGIPMFSAPSGFFANNGVYIIGQAPTGGATVSFSATSGAGVTMTFSGATLLGTASDVGRVLTILDGGIYKYATITAQSSTTVATVTITGTLSGTGPFANNILWLSGPPQTLGNTTAFSAPFAAVFQFVYLFFPSGAIFAGSASGWYLTQMSSTTVGTVFNFVFLAASGGIPTVPPLPLPLLIATGAGAFTGTTGAINAITFNVPANTIGPNGRLRVFALFSNNNSGNNKTYSIIFGGTSLGSVAETTNLSLAWEKDIFNAGVTNAQVTQPAGILGTGQAVGVNSHPQVDTTLVQQLSIQLNDAAATDWSGVEAFTIEVLAP